MTPSPRRQPDKATQRRGLHVGLACLAEHREEFRSDRVVAARQGCSAQCPQESPPRASHFQMMAARLVRQDVSLAPGSPRPELPALRGGFPHARSAGRIGKTSCVFRTTHTRCSDNYAAPRQVGPCRGHRDCGSGDTDQIRTGIPFDAFGVSYSRPGGRSPSRWQRVAIVEFIDVYGILRA